MELGLPTELERAVRVRLAHLEADGFAARLMRHDASLWGDDPARRAVAANSASAGSTPRRLMRRRPRRCVPSPTRSSRRDSMPWCCSAWAARVSRPRCCAARSASPPAIRTSPCSTTPRLLRSRTCSTTAIRPARLLRRLVQVGHDRRGLARSSGSPTPGHCQARRRSRALFVGDHGPRHPLETLARERGYRRVFTNPPDIGGRYSALSCFGLVPAALIGADLDGLLDSALEEARAPANPTRRPRAIPRCGSARRSARPRSPVGTR